ncbi:DUF2345 domain-containing protein, partial [Klebsiella pneumoniae]|uniref:DUF2345 domain-containing protein n=1 Tax=Klebsiella pneumoniae TaxID=573 RepID=UPI002DBDC78C
EVESHADTLSLTSLKDVTVQSTQGHLQLTAKNGITIACGGAYIQLTPEGEIKVHGPGLLSLKGQHNMEGPASQDFPLPELPSSVCKDCLKRALEIAQGFVPREVLKLEFVSPWMDKIRTTCQRAEIDHIDVIIVQCAVNFSVLPALTTFSNPMMWQSLY